MWGFRKYHELQQEVSTAVGQGHYEHAALLIEQQLALLKGIDEAFRVVPLLNLAHVQAKRGDTAAAKKTLHQCLHVAQADFKTGRYLARVFFQFAGVLSAEDNLQESGRYLSRAAQIFAKNGETEAAIACRVNIGSNHFRRSEYRAAIAELEAALGLVGAVGNQQLLDTINLRLGILYTLVGSHAVARRHLLRVSEQSVFRARARTMAAQGAKVPSGEQDDAAFESYVQEEISRLMTEDLV